MCESTCNWCLVFIHYLDDDRNDASIAAQVSYIIVETIWKVVALSNVLDFQKKVIVDVVFADVAVLEYPINRM